MLENNFHQWHSHHQNTQIKACGLSKISAVSLDPFLMKSSITFIFSFMIIGMNGDDYIYNPDGEGQVPNQVFITVILLLSSVHGCTGFILSQLVWMANLTGLGI